MWATLKNVRPLVSHVGGDDDDFDDDDNDLFNFDDDFDDFDDDDYDVEVVYAPE